MTDFLSILDKKVDDIEVPNVLPEGTYLSVVSKPYEEDKRGDDDKFTVYVFPCEILQAGDDIADQAGLEAYGDPKGKSFRIEFWFVNGDDSELSGEEKERNVNTGRKMQKFLLDTLLITKGSTKDAMTSAVGHEFYGSITHRENPNDAEVPYLECRNWGPVDDD